MTTKPYKATRDGTQNYVPCFWHLHMLMPTNNYKVRDEIITFRPGSKEGGTGIPQARSDLQSLSIFPERHSKDVDPQTPRISTCGSREIQKTAITKTSSVCRARRSGEARRGVDTRPPRGFACQIIHHGAQVGFHDAQGHRQQDQGQGPSEASLVLSDGTTDCSRGPLPPPSFLPPPRITDEASLVSLSLACSQCQKQCRDENGFKCHLKSESHMRQMVIFGQSGGKIVEEYSREFEKTFLQHFRTAHKHSRIAANVIYNEFIADRHHVHMNSTKVGPYDVALRPQFSTKLTLSLSLSLCVVRLVCVCVCHER